MFLTGGLESDFAFPVEPCVPVPGVYLQDRLEFSATSIDAALYEGHENSPYADAGSFRSCRSFMQVLAAFATSLPVWSLTSHSTYPTVLPAFTTLASAIKVAFRTARRKLIFNSMVVNVSPSARVAA